MLLEESLQSINQSAQNYFNPVQNFLIDGMQYDSTLTIKEKFEAYKQQWYIERGVSSSIKDIIDCPSYQKIIDMGESVLSLIIGELKKNPDHWFVALEEITKRDPVPDNIFGDILKMSKYWIAWAEENGIR